MRLEATKPEFSNSITDTLKEFLENEHKNTLMLKGQWGTGKTFAVRNFFEKGPGRDCRTYSYFSLAGQKILPDELDGITTDTASFWCVIVH